MSYILDALKRADAERERGAVPGLHAQPADMALPDEPRGVTLPPWAWGLGGLGVALLGMLAWSLWRGGEAPVDNGTRPSMAQQGADGQAGPWAQQGERSQPPMGMASGARGPQAGMHRQHPEGRMARADMDPQATGGMGMGTGQRPPMQAMRGESREDGTAVQGNSDGRARLDGNRRFMPPTDPASASRRSNATAHADIDTAAPEASTAKEASPASATASSRIYALNDLPDNVRRSLPQLVIGGAMYSDNPRSRMLVINTQLFHEGDKLGPDLTLEEIKLKSAVLRYKGYRYSVTY